MELMALKITTFNQNFWTATLNQRGCTNTEDLEYIHIKRWRWSLIFRSMVAVISKRTNDWLHHKRTVIQMSSEKLPKIFNMWPLRTFNKVVDGIFFIKLQVLINNFIKKVPITMKLYWKLLRNICFPGIICRPPIRDWF